MRKHLADAKTERARIESLEVLRVCQRHHTTDLDINIYVSHDT